MAATIEIVFTDSTKPTECVIPWAVWKDISPKAREEVLLAFIKCGRHVSLGGDCDPSPLV